MKKVLFYSILFLLTFLIIILFDFLISNSFLKNIHCHDYQTNQYYYELEKNCKGKYRFKKSFPLYNIYTDNNGLRIGKKEIIKDPKKPNIFLFGDSFTYGVGLEFEKTFAGLLSENIKQFNFFNFAVGSYSPSVHLYRLKKALENDLIPSRIIVFLDLTDVLDEATRWNYISQHNEVKLNNNLIYRRNFKENKSFKNKNFKLLTNISYYLNYNFRFLRSKIDIKINNNYKVKTSIQGNFTYTPRDELDKRFWNNENFELGLKKIEFILNEMKLIASEYNFKINLVVYPWAETLEFGQKNFDWSNFAKNICKKNCETIDLIPDFIDYKISHPNWINELYFLNDEHFNEKGAELVYKSLIKKIKFN